MKKVILSFALVLFATFSYANNTVKKSVAVSSFNAIEVYSMFQIEVVKSPNRSVEIEISENLEEYLVARENGRTLELYLDNVPSKKISSDDVVKAVIYTPSLIDVELSGAVSALFSGEFNESEFEMDLSGAVKVNGLKILARSGSLECSGAAKLYDSELKINSLEIDCSGASKVELSVESDVLSVDLSGANNISVEGKGEKLDIDASGAVKADFLKFAVQHAEVECSGAAVLKVSPVKTISFDISGASNVKYKGGDDLKILGLDISGAARVKSL